MVLGSRAWLRVELAAADCSEKSAPPLPCLISQMNEMQFQLRRAAPVLALLCLRGDLSGERRQD